MEPTTYVFGHKNPDTDSVVSAYAFAKLKNSTGNENYKPCRAGKLSPQTEYVFNRFDAEPPELISDMTPKVEYYMEENFISIRENQSLQLASLFMQKNNYHFLIVTDENGRYKSLLHYSSFAKNLINSLNPEHHIKILTNYSLIHQSIGGIFANMPDFSRDELVNCTIIAGAAKLESFKKTVEERPDQNLIVITGDREDIVNFSIEKKAYCIVITGGRTVSEETVLSARKNSVPIIVSQFDTISTSLLTTCATPVSTVSDSTIKPVKKYDTLRKCEGIFKLSNIPVIPVIDDDEKIAGILTESMTHRQPKISISLVDHNEPSQAVNGVENYQIKDIIDHHRIASITTKYPVNFINRVIGSTSTIIANLYDDSKIPLDKKTAGLLLSGILSDTLILKSATTTQCDIETAEKLAKITGLLIDDLGKEIMSAGTKLKDISERDLILQDLKEYSENGTTFSVSQIEVDSPSVIFERKANILASLEEERILKKRNFSALLVTDITKLDSYLFIKSDGTIEEFINYPKIEDGIYFLKETVSRKKQLIPLFTDILGRI